MTLLAVVQLGRGPLPVDEPVLHADDEGLLRGRAVFETLRVYGGVPFRLDDHLVRLARSATRLGLPEPDGRAFAAAAVLAVETAAAPGAVLRLLWTPGREGQGRPVGLALVSALPPGLDELRVRGLRLAVVEWSPSVLGGVKSTSYASNIAARDRAGQQGADDALLVDPEGMVLESPVSNVWWREGASLITPSIELPILAGVTRATLLELASAAGYAVETGAFPLERLLCADEAFLSSSVREAMPVVAVDGAPIGPGTPGPAAAALQRALRAAAEATR
jgi:branched-subunit amino acid aminotransferase/4-amino-4-deoxychorismate lyase